MPDSSSPLPESEYLTKGPCDSCGSSDACATYTDGHLHCFSCGYHTRGDGAAVTTTQRKPMAAGLIEVGESQALAKRGLSEETCRKWGYTVGTMGGKPVQIANYRNTEGQVVAQKVRFPDKKFTFLGDSKAAGLYGAHLWRDGGKRVVVTEGEIDALSISQMQGNRWPVVSLPNGADGAKKALQRNLEWLEMFEEVVLCFDNDEPGAKAVQDCALLFTPGKAKVAKLPLKDANEMLQAGREKETIDAIWGAKVYRPDGIVAGIDLWAKLEKPDATPSVPYPWAGLSEKTRGMRRGELVTLTAGTGIGKSAICRELAHYLMGMGETLGYIALEENTVRTALGLMGLAVDKPLHISREGIDEATFKKAFDSTVGSGRCYLYDHFGSCDSENLMSRIRYLARGCGCSWVVLDHLSIVVSGMDGGEDERKLIDRIMTKLRTLVEETGIGLILVSHLKRPEGKGHEDGAQTSLAQLRGSAAIGQLSDIVIGLERNQQAEEDRHTTTVRVLKNRFSGETGEACRLIYNPKTGRLAEGSVFAAQGGTTDF